MGKLLVTPLAPNAVAPTAANPGEDLGFDLYATEDVFLFPSVPTLVPTGIAAVYEPGPDEPQGLYGLEIGDRSGMAAKFGIHHLAGKIDAGYRNEIKVVLILLGPPKHIHPDDYAEVVDGIRSGRWGRWLRASRLDREASYNPQAETDVVLEQLENPYSISVELLRRLQTIGVRIGYQIRAGERIAQIMPRLVQTTSQVEIVAELPPSKRGMGGFGSTGK